ncbi:MAG TPA: hypothetical protein VFS67_36560 [Polyangiaceae bacterium]|nr:hypothetical protein [Polyangiaceae bacterium]
MAFQGQPLRRRLALGWFCGALTVALVAYWLPAAYQRVTGASELEAADTARNGARAFQPGNSSAILPVAGHEVGALVCFEAASEAAVRESMSSGDARWLVNLASDAWFDGSTEPAFHWRWPNCAQSSRDAL